MAKWLCRDSKIQPPAGPRRRRPPTTVGTLLWCSPARQSSESLAFRIGLWLIPDAFSNARGSPIYSASLSGSCRFPYPGGFHGCTGLLLHRGCCLRRLCIGSATASSDRPVWSEQRNEAAEFASCYDPIPLLALPRPGLLRPSFRRGCRHPTASVMTKRVSVNSRCRTFTGKARGLMGCKQRNAKNTETRTYGIVSLRLLCSLWSIHLRLWLAALRI